MMIRASALRTRQTCRMPTWSISCSLQTDAADETQQMSRELVRLFLHDLVAAVVNVVMCGLRPGQCLEQVHRVPTIDDAVVPPVDNQDGRRHGSHRAMVSVVGKPARQTQVIALEHVRRVRIRPGLFLGDQPRQALVVAGIERLPDERFRQQRLRQGQDPGRQMEDRGQRGAMVHRAGHDRPANAGQFASRAQRERAADRMGDQDHGRVRRPLVQAQQGHQVTVQGVGRVRVGRVRLVAAAAPEPVVRDRRIPGGVHLPDLRRPLQRGPARPMDEHDQRGVVGAGLLVHRQAPTCDRIDALQRADLGRRRARTGRHGRRWPRPVSARRVCVCVCPAPG